MLVHELSSAAGTRGGRHISPSSARPEPGPPGEARQQAASTVVVCVRSGGSGLVVARGRGHLTRDAAGRLLIERWTEVSRGAGSQDRLFLFQGAGAVTMAPR